LGRFTHDHALPDYKKLSVTAVQACDMNQLIYEKSNGAAKLDYPLDYTLIGSLDSKECG